MGNFFVSPSARNTIFPHASIKKCPSKTVMYHYCFQTKKRKMWKFSYLPLFSNGWCFIDLRSGILRLIWVITSDIEYRCFASPSFSLSNSLSVGCSWLCWRVCNVLLNWFRYFNKFLFCMSNVESEKESWILLYKSYFKIRFEI